MLGVKGVLQRTTASVVNSGVEVQQFSSAATRRGDTKRRLIESFSDGNFGKLLKTHGGPSMDTIVVSACGPCRMHSMGYCDSCTVRNHEDFPVALVKQGVGHGPYPASKRTCSHCLYVVEDVHAKLHCCSGCKGQSAPHYCNVRCRKNAWKDNKLDCGYYFNN